MQVLDQPESFNLLNTLLFNIPQSPAYSSCAQYPPVPGLVSGPVGFISGPVSPIITHQTPLPSHQNSKSGWARPVQGYSQLHRYYKIYKSSKKIFHSSAILSLVFTILIYTLNYYYLSPVHFRWSQPHLQAGGPESPPGPQPPQPSPASRGHRLLHQWPRR